MKRSPRRILGGAIASAGVVCLLIVGTASPSSAHRGHGSCAEGTTVFVPPDEPGELGALAREVARSGGFQEFEEALHAALCEPRP